MSWSSSMLSIGIFPVATPKAPERNQCVYLGRKNQPCGSLGVDGARADQLKKKRCSARSISGVNCAAIFFETSVSLIHGAISGSLVRGSQ